MDFSEIEAPNLVGNVRSSQNLQLGIGLLRRGIKEYELFNIIGSGVALQANSWKEISIYLLGVFNNLNLANLVGVA